MESHTDQYECHEVRITDDGSGRYCAKVCQYFAGTYVGPYKYCELFGKWLTKATPLRGRLETGHYHRCDGCIDGQEPDCRAKACQPSHSIPDALRTP